MGESKCHRAGLGSASRHVARVAPTSGGSELTDMRCFEDAIGHNTIQDMRCFEDAIGTVPADCVCWHLLFWLQFMTENRGQFWSIPARCILS